MFNDDPDLVLVSKSPACKRDKKEPVLKALQISGFRLRTNGAYCTTGGLACIGCRQMGAFKCDYEILNWSQS